MPHTITNPLDQGKSQTFVVVNPFAAKLHAGEKMVLQLKANLAQVDNTPKRVAIRTLVPPVSNIIASRNFKFQVLLDVKWHVLDNLFDSFGNPLSLWTSIG